MSKEINQYTAATGIDAVNDQLLIDPGGTGAYNKINRNTLLGITGSPIGSSDTQTLTNKTLGNTNIITVLDSNLTLQDNVDPTKQAQFQLSGNTTGTTRSYALPNASVTLASLTGTETLTNKTLTSPVISGGTIDNTTITVDAISGHTTSTIVTVANLQISNGVLNSANAVTATSIAAGAVQPQALTSGTGSGWAWTSFTPSWTNLTVGTGGGAANAGASVQIGKTVFVRSSTVLGTSGSSVTSFPYYTLPIAGKTAITATGFMVGTVFCQIGPGTNFIGFASTAYQTGSITPAAITSSAGAVSPFSGTVPGTFTAGSSIQMYFTYEAA